MKDTKRHQLEEAEKLYFEAVELLEQRQYRASIPLLDSILSIFEETQYNSLYVKSLMKLGLAHLGTYHTEKAFYYLQKSQQVNGSLLLLKKEEEGELLYYLGQTYSQKADYASALSSHQEALRLSLEVLPEASRLVSDCYNSIGFMYGRLGNYWEQLAFHQKNLPIRLEIYGEYHFKTGITYNNLGVSYCDLEDYSQGKEAFAKALEVQKKVLNTEEHSEIGKLYNNLAYCFGKEENLQQALRYHEKALFIRKKVLPPTHGEILQNYASIGGVHAQMKNYETALSYLFKTLELGKQVIDKNHYSNHFIYGRIAYCYREMNKEGEEWEVWYKKALDASIEHLGNQHPKVASNYSNLGLYYHQKGAYDLSIQYFEKALKIEKDTLFKKNESIAYTYCRLGDVYKSQGEFGTALQYYQKALISTVYDFDCEQIEVNPELNAIVRGDVFFRALKRKADACFALFKRVPNQGAFLKLAIETYSLLDEYINQLRKRIQGDNAQLLISERGRNTYESAIEAYMLLQKNDAREKEKSIQTVFNFSEKIKAILLLQKVKTNLAKAQANIAPNLLQLEKDLAFRLNALDKQIKIEKSKGEKANETFLQEWQNQYFNYYQKYEQLTLQFEQDYPEYYRLKYDIQTVTIDSLQSSLNEGELMISYFVGEKYLYIFGITQNDFEVLQQEKPSNFDQLIKAFNKGLNRTMLQKYAHAAHELYQMLLAPILQHSSFNENRTTQQLILIPHDSLSALPFEALLCSLPEEINALQYAGLDYLLLHYDVVYHYSATLWWQGQKGLSESGLEDSFVGFAPVYQDLSKQEFLDGKGLVLEHPTESIAPTEYPKHPQELAGMRSVRIGEKDYQALLYSETEVKGIQAAFEAKELPQSTFLHEQATKNNFEEAVKGKKYVLIAAHGFYNKAQPELSGIIFSPENEEENEEAVLYVNDAYHLDLKQTDLVVLSACESGIGKLAKGEGMMAVNRGFLYSGANNVIFTLFKVYDEESSQLTQALFWYILEGKSYAQALRLAKLELIKSREVGPKAWAGFVLIGG